MRDTLTVYTGLVRSSAQVALTYRGRLVLGVVTGLFPFLMLAVWLTVVAESGPPAGWTTSDFLSYYTAAAVLWHLSGGHVVWQWDSDLRSGDLSARLLRPVHPFHQYAAADLGYRVVYLVSLLPALAVVALLLPGVRYDLDPARAAAFAAAVVLAYLTSLLMASTFALVGFWSTQTANVWMLWWGLGLFVSGWIAPVELMPGWLREVAVVLPFRATVGFPIELLMGRLDAAGTAYAFGTGTAWLVGFAVVYRVAWRRGIRRYQAVAG